MASAVRGRSRTGARRLRGRIHVRPAAATTGDLLGIGPAHFRGIAQQSLRRLALSETLAQKRLVGRVLQEPAHQVRHAGDELAVRRIHPHPLTHVHQRAAQRRRHAVEHLILHGAGRQVHRLAQRHRVGDGADVVAGNGQPHRIVVFQEQLGDPLVRRVALPLALEHRHRPALEAGVHRLVVPICAFDQPHLDGRAAVRRPFDETTSVVFGAAQIRLQHDADVGIVLELGIVADAAENVECQILEVVVLHVDLNVGAPLFGQPENGPQPFHDHVGALIGRDGIELGVESGQLHRHVGPGQRAPRRFVHLLDLGPLGRVRSVSASKSSK